MRPTTGGEIGRRAECKSWFNLGAVLMCAGLANFFLVGKGGILMKFVLNSVYFWVYCWLKSVEMAKELGVVETLMVRDEFFRKREKEIFVSPYHGYFQSTNPTYSGLTYVYMYIQRINLVKCTISGWELNPWWCHEWTLKWRLVLTHWFNLRSYKGKYIKKKKKNTWQIC